MAIFFESSILSLYSASIIFVVRGRTTVVAMVHALKLSFCTMSAGRRPIVMLPNASPKSTHHISPRVIFYSLPHGTHGRMCLRNLLFVRYFRIHCIYALYLCPVDSLFVCHGLFFCQELLHFLKDAFKRRNIQLFKFGIEIRIMFLLYYTFTIALSAPHTS